MPEQDPREALTPPARSPRHVRAEVTPPVVTGERAEQLALERMLEAGWYLMAAQLQASAGDGEVPTLDGVRKKLERRAALGEVNQELAALRARVQAIRDGRAS